jgi:hypothetical protein
MGHIVAHLASSNTTFNDVSSHVTIDLLFRITMVNVILYSTQTMWMIATQQHAWLT